MQRETRGCWRGDAAASGCRDAAFGLQGPQCSPWARARCLGPRFPKGHPSLSAAALRPQRSLPPKADMVPPCCLSALHITPCSRADHHNWKHCPHRHPGEVAAQRRHPSVHKPAFCMNLKLYGSCAAGDDCPFSHNTFEMSLHPERYKTTLCNLGDKCNREICFFAHSTEDLRTPDVTAPLAAGSQVAAVPGSAIMRSAAGGPNLLMQPQQQQAYDAQQQYQLQQMQQAQQAQQMQQQSTAVDQQMLLLQMQAQQQQHQQQANELAAAHQQLLLAQAGGGGRVMLQDASLAGLRGESFSSQCSTATSFISGAGGLLRGATGSSLPVSPLLDRSAASFTLTDRSAGSFTSMLGVVPERPHSFTVGDRPSAAGLLAGLRERPQSFTTIAEAGGGGGGMRQSFDTFAFATPQQHQEEDEAAAWQAAPFAVERSCASWSFLERRTAGLLDRLSVEPTQRSFTLGQRPTQLLQQYQQQQQPTGLAWYQSAPTSGAASLVAGSQALAHNSGTLSSSSLFQQQQQQQAELLALQQQQHPVLDLMGMQQQQQQRDSA